MSTIKSFKKPNLNAPRYRAEGLSLLNESTYKKFILKYPEYSNITIEQYKNIVLKFNEKLWNTVIEERDGIELPCSLGHLFLGSCQTPTKKKSNVDFGKSIKTGVVVLHRNFTTDSLLGKIFYTNALSGYRFKHREVWEFWAGRTFSRTASIAYKEDFKKYIQVENNLKISTLYKKKMKKDWLKNNESQPSVEYNEFNFD